MQIKINSKALLNALALATKAIASKPTLPILGNFLFTTSEGKLVITATDTSIDITCSVTAECEGAMVVPAKILFDVIKTLPDSEISLYTENNSCIVDWGMGNSALPIYPVEDYPQLNIPTSSEGGINLKGGLLKAAFNHTLPCTAKDTMRPQLGGVFCNVMENVVDFVATDSHVLSIYPIKGENLPVQSFVIPGGAASLVKDAVGDDDDVSIVCGQSGILFTFGNVTISARKVEGNFPRYASIIPQNNTRQALADKGQLISSLRRVSVCSSKTSNLIKLTLNADTEIKAESQDLGFSVAATEFIPGTMYQGDSLEIGFRGDYLLKVLNLIDSDKVVLKFADARRAALVVPQDTSVDPCTTLLMPILIQ